MATSLRSISPWKWAQSRLFPSRTASPIAVRIQAFFASFLHRPEPQPTLSKACCSGLDVSSDLNFAARELSALSPTSITNTSIAQNIMGLCSGVNVVCGAQGMANAYHQLEQADRIGSTSGKREAGSHFIGNAFRTLAGFGLVGYQATGLASRILQSTKGASPAALVSANFALLLVGLLSLCVFFLVLGGFSAYKLYQSYSFGKALAAAEKTGALIPFLQKKLQIDPKTFAVSCKRKDWADQGKKLLKEDNEYISETEKEQILSNQIPESWKGFYASRLKQFGLTEKTDLLSLIGLEHEYKKALLRKESSIASLTNHRVVEELKSLDKNATNVHKLSIEALSSNKSNTKFYAALLGLCILSTVFLGLMCFTAPWLPVTILAFAIVVLPLMTALDYKCFVSALAQMKNIGKKDFIANGSFAAATALALTAGIVSVLLLHMAIMPLIPLILLTLVEISWAYYKHQKLKEKEEELYQQSLNSVVMKFS